MKYVLRNGVLVDKSTLRSNGQKSAAFHKFPEGVFRDITPDEVWVNDKPHLKRLLKEHGAYAPGLLDGGDYGREI